MAEIFINYRTGDGEDSAVAIEGYLSERFGTQRVFRASKSIQLGDLFDEELLKGVRRSSVLLAVIGGKWTGFPQLQRADDWVRREIQEAFRCSIPVVPVLVGRTTRRLSPDDLPRGLGRLARCQSIRFDTQNTQYGLLALGDRLALMTPELAEAEKAGAVSLPAASESVRNSVSGDAHDGVIQAGNVSGDLGGTVIKNAHGPLHTGSGAQHLPHFTGDGAQYIAGDHHGRQKFVRERRREDGAQ
ncbi:toll/interleukin-1 receptor domain-containing protein [Streptomyces sp. NPDC001985]|uniref:toll/interleukin-1 receptor domain-containing protein n=1 Tax=Streptomyces sp. NPDC001985 TaxID=3154406 RepID=UPI0033283C9A